MSQISFDTTLNGNPVQVVTGWDRPLGYAHLTVYDRDGEVVYCNLDEPDCFKQRAGDVLARLDSLSVPYPAELQTKLYAHQSADAGNVVVRLEVEQGG